MTKETKKLPWAKDVRAFLPKSDHQEHEAKLVTERALLFDDSEQFRQAIASILKLFHDPSKELISLPDIVAQLRVNIRAVLALADNQDRSFGVNLILQLPLTAIVSDPYTVMQLKSGYRDGDVYLPAVKNVGQLLQCSLSKLVAIVNGFGYQEVQRLLDELAIFGLTVPMPPINAKFDAMTLEEFFPKKSRTVTAAINLLKDRKRIHTIGELRQCTPVELGEFLAAGKMQRVVGNLARKGVLLREAFVDPVTRKPLHLDPSMPVPSITSLEPPKL